jgi:hypothetical protein
MTRYQAKILHVNNVNQPDDYDPSLGIFPSANFVTARDNKGQVLSRYGDLNWNRTPYDPNNRRCNISFQFWRHGELTEQRQLLLDEIRWLMFIVIYLFPSPLTNGGIGHYICLFRSLARFAELHSMTVRNILTDPNLLTEAASGSRIAICRNLLQNIDKLGPKLSGYEINLIALTEDMKARVTQYRSGLKQTVPIPSLIYTKILSALSDEIHEIKENIGNILLLAKAYHADPLIGFCRAAQVTNAAKFGIILENYQLDFFELVEKYNLSKFWQKHSLTEDGTSIRQLLNRAQRVAALQIQAFTGMRGDEVDTLPYYCLEEQKRYGDDRIHYIVTGSVTKNKNGLVRKVQWVTSSSGMHAIRLAQKIASVIYEINGMKIRRLVNNDKPSYLFISTNWLGNVRAKETPHQWDFKKQLGLAKDLKFNIEKVDLEELLSIDPHRQWESEPEFQIGQPWPLKRHQLRRSLALYAHASGLVSLPSLKRQLQHITEEMTLYYSRGSLFANKFLNETSDDHFGVEYRATKSISHGLAYLANVLLRDQNKLFGPHVLFNHLHHSDGLGNVLINRDQTIKAVGRGLYTYKPTPIGGCANPKKCEIVGISVLHTGCMTDQCKHFIGDTDKTKRVIEIKTLQVRRLRQSKPESFEYRVENAELLALENGLAEAKLYQKKRMSRNGQ